MDAIAADPVSILFLGALLALAPMLAVLVTSFSKIIIVFYLLRQALGLQQAPPGIVLNSLAIILSAFIMLPAFTALSDSVDRYKPTDKSTSRESIERVLMPVREPLREFLKSHTTPTELKFFATAAERINTKASLAKPRDDDFLVLIPAFTISELSSAFYIGFLIFLPFLAIDLIVANVLLALGMQMLSPTIISLPLKLLLFVALDGWSRLIHSLVLSY
jgi:type III secretion protein R